MNARIKSIQLQNRIQTGEGTGKTRRTHTRSVRLTNGRRQETQTKRGNRTAKRKIVGHHRHRRNQARGIGNYQVWRPARRRNIESKRSGRRNPRYQKELGRSNERDERKSTVAMSMEGQPLMVSRKDLDTK